MKTISATPDRWSRKDLALQCLADMASSPVLEPDSVQDNRSYRLRAAGIDPKTGGALGVVSVPVLDADGYVSSITIKGWRRLPSGNQSEQEWIRITVKPGSDPVEFDQIMIMGLIVPLTTANINRTLEAIRQIHLDLIDHRIPSMKRIIENCYLEEVTGETLPMIGHGTDGSFDFALSPAFVAQAQAHGVSSQPSLRLPYDVVASLFGADSDDFSPHLRLKGKPRRTGVEAKNAIAFAADVSVQEDDSTLQTRVDIKPLVVPNGVTAQPNERLVDTFWREAAPGVFELEKLVLMGRSVPIADDRATMQALGVASKTIEAFRRSDYPAFLDYLAAFDLLSLCYPLSPPPSAKDGGRAVMLVMGGNNFEEIVADFGKDIGMNMRIILSEALREDGTIDRFGVGHDMGLGIHSDPAEWPSATPDITDFQDDVQHWFLTHRHLDHKDGLTANVLLGKMVGKTVYGSPEVIHMCRQMLIEAGCKENSNLWPRFVPLTGTGWIHLKDQNGIKRMSVHYSVDGAEHSARNTAYRYVSRYGDHIHGSYHNRGDERCGIHNTEDYDGPATDRGSFDREFTAGGVHSLLAEEPHLAAVLAGRRDTYTEFDLTNYLKRGHEPTEAECFPRIQALMECFDDLGIIFAQISTNDNRFETGLRLATHLQRNITEIGAALEKTARMFNKLGVNRALLEPHKPRDNINDYLQWYARKLSEPLIREDLDALNAEQTKGDAANKRRVRDLKKSIADKAIKPVMRRGRTSQKAKAFFKDDPGKRFVYVTGTQGNWAELESTLCKLADSRSMMDLDPRDRPAARPIKVNENVIFLSQGTIPGNRAYRDQLIHKLTKERGFMVVESEGDATIFHNIQEPYFTRVKEILNAANADVVVYRGDGKKVEAVSADQPFMAGAYCTHPPGHAYREGVRLVVRTNNPDLAGGQHTDDPKTASEFIRDSEQSGHRTPGLVFPAFHAVQFDMGASAADAKVQSIGTLVRSLLLVRFVRKFKQNWGGFLETQRVVLADMNANTRNDGLIARENGVYRQSFGRIALGRPANDPAHGRAHGTQPALNERMTPPERRRTRVVHVPRPWAA